MVYPAGPELAPQASYTIQLSGLPHVSLVFAMEHALVAAGHDCEPVLFEGSLKEGWTRTRSLDDPDTRTTGAGRGAVGRLGNSEAFNVFRAADSRGVGGATSAVTGAGLSTVHQNTITSVRAYEGEAGSVSRVSTTGVDGRVALWRL